MSAITVRTMLQIILENELEMDDEIHFCLSDETAGDTHEINFVCTEKWGIVGDKHDKLSLVFDLDEIRECECHQ